MRIGIVDIGTLSLRFDLYALTPQDERVLVHKSRASPRLGEDLHQSGCISEAGIGRLIAALLDIKKIVANEQVEKLILTGTAAFRDASNAEEVIRRIKKETGLGIRVLSGEQEARLTALGILTFEKEVPAEAAFVDIGGGSTEVTLCHHREFKALISLPLGSLTLEREFRPHQKDGLGVNPDTFQALKTRVATVVSALSDSVNLPVNSLYGSSGTARNLERLTGKSTLSRQDLQSLIGKLRNCNFESLLNLPGIEANRATLILPGSVILLTVMDLLKVDAVRVTNYSLRHGVLAEEMKNLSK